MTTEAGVVEIRTHRQCWAALILTLPKIIQKAEEAEEVVTRIRRPCLAVLILMLRSSMVAVEEVAAEVCIETKQEEQAEVVAVVLDQCPLAVLVWEEE